MGMITIKFPRIKSRWVNLYKEQVCAANKISFKFQLKKEDFYLFLKDGTEIDDDEYFENLDNQIIIYASKSPNLKINAAGKGNNYLVSDIILINQNMYLNLIQKTHQMNF